jgi:DNA-directed RNA polymerase specialized sigma24 family protein
MVARVGTKSVVAYSGLYVDDASERGVAIALDPLLTSRVTSIESIGELFARHHRRLVGLAAAVTLDRSVADEIVQEAFAGLTWRIEDVRDPEAYLQRSVINLAIRVVRRREKARSAVLGPIDHVGIPEVDELWDVVAKLPVQQRAVVVLRFWDDLSQQQIASVLGIPLGSVKSTLHRALLTLKRQLGTDQRENR